jgi:hypothetical protein
MECDKPYQVQHIDRSEFPPGTSQRPATGRIGSATVKPIEADPLLRLPRNVRPDYERAADFLFATPGPTINMFAAHHDNGKVYGRTFEKIAADRASLIDWMKRGQVRGFNIYFNINGLRVKLDLIKASRQTRSARRRVSP